MQQLRQHPGLTDDRHEVGVASPPRDDVLVQVSRNAGACDRSEIHADVESLRTAHRADRLDGSLGEHHELGRFVDAELTDIRNMPIRDDEQVASVLNYVRTNFGNRYRDVVTPGAVAARRAALLQEAGGALSIPIDPRAGSH